MTSEIPFMKETIFIVLKIALLFAYSISTFANTTTYIVIKIYRQISLIDYNGFQSN